MNKNFVYRALIVSVTIVALFQWVETIWHRIALMLPSTPGVLPSRLPVALDLVSRTSRYPFYVDGYLFMYPYVSLVVNFVLLSLILNRVYRIATSKSFTEPTFFQGGLYWVSQFAVFGSGLSLALLQLRHFVPGAGTLGLTLSIALYLLAWTFVVSELRRLRWFELFISGHQSK